MSTTPIPPKKRTRATPRTTLSARPAVNSQPARPTVRSAAPARQHAQARRRVPAKPKSKMQKANGGFGAAPMIAMLIFGVVAGFWIGLAFQQAGFSVIKQQPPLQTYRPPPDSSFSF